MDAASIAKLLIDAPAFERASILTSNSDIDPSALARELHDICYEAWTEEPSRVRGIIEVFDELCRSGENAAVCAHAEWSRGIGALVEGRLEDCIKRLDASRSLFIAADDELAAAQTQTAKLYALALLGRYDEAIEVGVGARDVFLAHGDLYSTGKIEHNIGNLYWRRDLYAEATPYLNSAHERFSAINDQRQLAMVENCQAFVLTLQNDLERAELLYKCALERAAINGLTVTQAEIEIGLSNMYLFEGRYDAALACLERARSAYEKLGLEARSFGCLLETAEVYRELGLLPEAIAAYRSASSYFESTGIRSELAQSLVGEAHALTSSGDAASAGSLLDRAALLYTQEVNAVGHGTVQLARARLSTAGGDLAAALGQAQAALEEFKGGDNMRLGLFAQWLIADVLASQGRRDAAIQEMRTVLAQACGRSRDLEFLCNVSLGKMTGDVGYLTAAVRTVEESRAGLAADELRMAYLAARLVPYHELIKIELAQGRASEALAWHERSRARVLNDQLLRSASDSLRDRKLDLLQRKINWYNNRIDRSETAIQEASPRLAKMRAALRDAERHYAERLRQLRAQEPSVTSDLTLETDELINALGPATLVEFAFIDDELVAFVVSSAGVRTVRGLGKRKSVEADVRRFLFQLNSARIGDQLSEDARRTASDRLSARSRQLYETLIVPLEIRSERLLIVPAGGLHTLPFQALRGDGKYLAEEHVVSYAPSAVLLQQLMKQEAVVPKECLIAAVSDARTPMLEEEAASVARIFPNAVILTGKDASFANLATFIGGADIVHFACHGRFRADNPAFSSLDLAEKVSFKDLHTLGLKRSIIVLSACESGLNAVDPCEDLVGLTSAFFAAGAATLVMSLWRVDDAAALDLMKIFYSRLTAGRTPAEALADAQRRSISTGAHPYLWSQFIVSGRG